MARYLSRETEPFGKWKGIPVYLTTIMVAVMVLGLVACAVLQTTDSFGLLRRMIFVVPRADWGNVVALVLYPLVDQFHFFTPFAIFCMYGWSIGIETHLGRRVLSTLLVLLVVVPAAVLVLLSHGLGFPGALMGNIYVTCGMVVAFATLYPNAEWLGGIPFKFVAMACVFCGSFMALAEKQVVTLLALWGNCLVGFFYIRYALEQEYDDHVPLGSRFRQWFRRKPKFRVVPRDKGAEFEPEDAPSESEGAVSAEVDAILDKVARSGLHSLTAAEHKKLQQAREELQRRDQR